MRRTPSRQSLVKIKPQLPAAPDGSEDRVESRDRSYDEFRRHVRETADQRTSRDEKVSRVPDPDTNSSPTVPLSVTKHRIIGNDDEVQRLNRSVSELREHLSETLSKNEELISLLHEKDMMIASLKRELLCADEKSDQLSGISSDHDRIIMDLSNDLQASHAENAQLKREVDDYRCKCTDLESELFKMKDEAIAADSQLARRTSSTVASEYDLLYSILDGLSVGSIRESVGATRDGSATDVGTAVYNTTATDNSVQSSHETESEDMDSRHQKDRDFHKYPELMDHVSALEEQLQESTMIVVHREKEISTLIAAQQSFLEEQTYLRNEIHELRQQKIDAQSRINEYEDKIRLFKVEISELKNRQHRLQLENLKYSSSVPPLLKASASSEIEEFPDTYDYANLSLSEFNEVIIQKLIMVRNHFPPYILRQFLAGPYIREDENKKAASRLHRK